MSSKLLPLSFWAGLLLVGLLGLMSMMNSAPVFAQSNQEKILGQLCDGPNRDFDANCNANAAENEAAQIFRRVVQTALWVAGIVSFVMVIIGGLMYVFSSGGPEQTARARSTIIYALVGLTVAFAGIFLIEFVLDETATNNPSLDDRLPTESNTFRGGR